MSLKNRTQKSASALLLMDDFLLSAGLKNGADILLYGLQFPQLGFGKGVTFLLCVFLYDKRGLILL